MAHLQTILGSLWLAVAAGIAGAPSFAAAPTGKGILRLAVETDPHSLDAAQVFSNEEAMLGFLMFNTLLDPAPAGGFVPVLAEALPEISGDGRILTFRLRRDVRFSNGEELTADDVVYTFERTFDPRTGAASASYFRSLEGNREFEEARHRESAAPVAGAARHPSGRWIEPLTLPGVQALDRHTVQIRLSQPDLAFQAMLTTPPAAIVCRSAARTAGRSFATRPVGTGPYALVRWVRGARIRFARNPHHFRRDRSGPEGVDVLVNVDRTTQAMMFERGELDFQHYIPDPDFHRIRRDPGMRETLHAVRGSTPTYAFLNCEIPPLTNRLVRIALNHAVDKQALVQHLAQRCVPARGPLPAVIRGFNRDLSEYAFDLPRAPALLAEAGVTNGFRVTLWTNRDDYRWVRIALFLQQALLEVGVTVEIREVSFSALLEAAGRRGDVAMGVSDWVSAIDDPKETLDTVLNGEHITDEACQNFAFYSNPTVHQLFHDGVATADPVQRLEIYRRIERQIVEDAPWIFLVQFNTEVLVQPWLKGFTPRGLWPPARLEHCWLER